MFYRSPLPKLEGFRINSLLSRFGWHYLTSSLSIKWRIFDQIDPQKGSRKKEKHSLRKIKNGAVFVTSILKWDSDRKDVKPKLVTRTKRFYYFPVPGIPGQPNWILILPQEDLELSAGSCSYCRLVSRVSSILLLEDWLVCQKNTSRESKIGVLVGKFNRFWQKTDLS